MYSTTIKVSTGKSKQVLDITDRIERFIAELGVAGGLCNLLVTHTTAGLRTGESIEGTDEDLMEVLERVIPKIDFRHAHNPSHAPDHMIGSIVGASLTIPIRGGRLQLGTWQRVLLVECNGPRERNVVTTVLLDFGLMSGGGLDSDGMPALPGRANT